MKNEQQRPKQLSFASYEFAQKKRVTRREKFLAEMEQVVPWARLEAPRCQKASADARRPSKRRLPATAGWQRLR